MGNFFCLFVSILFIIKVVNYFDICQSQLTFLTYELFVHEGPFCTDFFWYFLVDL